MINEAAFELVCKNMQETPTNNKKTFARYMLGIDVGEFATKLLDAWTHADPDNQERLAIAYPQLATAMLEWQTLPEKKRGKYLEHLAGGK